MTGALADHEVAALNRHIGELWLLGHIAFPTPRRTGEYK